MPRAARRAKLRAIAGKHNNTALWSQIDCCEWLPNTKGLETQGESREGLVGISYACQRPFGGNASSSSLTQEWLADVWMFPHSQRKPLSLTSRKTSPTQALHHLNTPDGHQTAMFDRETTSVHSRDAGSHMGRKVEPCMPNLSHILEKHRFPDLPCLRCPVDFYGKKGGTPFFVG